MIPLIISVHIKYENITVYGYIINPQFFLFFGTNIVVLSSIILSLIYRKKDISEFNYIDVFLIAFGLISIAFFCLSLPKFIGKEYSSYSLILFFIFISMSEIFILPAGYSYITKILNFDGTAIAVWLYCCGSISIYCSEIISSNIKNTHFLSIMSLISVLILVLCCLILFMKTFLNDTKNI